MHLGTEMYRNNANSHFYEKCHGLGWGVGTFAFYLYFQSAVPQYYLLRQL